MKQGFINITPAIIRCGEVRAMERVIGDRALHLLISVIQVVKELGLEYGGLTQTSLHNLFIHSGVPEDQIMAALKAMEDYKAKDRDAKRKMGIPDENLPGPFTVKLINEEIGDIEIFYPKVVTEWHAHLLIYKEAGRKAVEARIQKYKQTRRKTAKEEDLIINPSSIDNQSFIDQSSNKEGRKEEIKEIQVTSVSQEFIKEAVPRAKEKMRSEPGMNHPVITSEIIPIVEAIAGSYPDDRELQAMKHFMNRLVGEYGSQAPIIKALQKMPDYYSNLSWRFIRENLGNILKGRKGFAKEARPERPRVLAPVFTPPTDGDPDALDKLDAILKRKKTDEKAKGE